ncbi:MAG: hypothetical protein RL175_1244, partial [Pseudomonadota bacterium]
HQLIDPSSKVKVFVGESVSIVRCESNPHLVVVG